MKSSLLVACIGLAISTGLVQSSSYGGGYDAGAYGGSGSGAAGSGGERPKVNLGISLKVPAMKINLGRMNMPRISIRAKIKQSHGPKVINVPEMHIDTNSKIPGPEGAHAAHGGSGNGYESSYGSSDYSSSGAYEAPTSSYGQSDSYSSSQSSSYGGQPSSYEPPQSSYQPQSYSHASQDTSSYGQQTSYGGMSSYGEPAPPPPQNYEPTYPSQAASYEPAASTYDDSSSPSSYGNQNYAGHRQPFMYIETGSQPTSSYRGPATNTRNQYGSSPSVYQNQMPYSSLKSKSYQKPSLYSSHRAPQQNIYIMSEAPTSGYSKGYSASGASYSNALANAAAQYIDPSSYAQQPTMNNQYYNQYSRPANQYSSDKSQYQYSSKSQPPLNSYAANQASMSNSYSSPYAATNSAPGYSPIEPGSTMLSASNDNYDGLTRVTVASSPAKDQSYGIQSYGQQQSYQPTSYQTHSAYQKPSYQPQQTYSGPQPIFDDNTNYSGMSQANYVNRMNSPFEQNGYIKSY